MIVGDGPLDNASRPGTLGGVGGVRGVGDNDDGGVGGVGEGEEPADECEPEGVCHRVAQDDQVRLCLGDGGCGFEGALADHDLEAVGQ